VYNLVKQLISTLDLNLSCKAENDWLVKVNCLCCYFVSV